MNISIVFKKILSSIVFRSGIVDRRLKNYSSQKYLILMYHRVLSESEINECIQPGMYVSQDTFKMHLRFLRDCFHVVTVFDLCFNLTEIIGRTNNKPICALTFDDGWQDFYKYAFPVLKEYEIPATVFLPTEYIGTDQWFWTDRLAHLLMQKKRRKNQIQSYMEADTFVNKIERLSGAFEFQLEKSIEMLKGLHHDKIDDLLINLSNRRGAYQQLMGRSFLSWEEVREMRESGLVSYGSHTASHHLLATLDSNDVKKELMQSRQKLVDEGVVENSFIPFCYPNGSYNGRIVKMVKDAGYSMAVTTQNNWNDLKSNPFLLQRVGIHQDMTSSMAMLGYRIVKKFKN